MFKKSKGFTLIELLIVVAIIGILAALLIPNAIVAIQKARQKAAMKDVQTIMAASLDYVIDHGAVYATTGNMVAAVQMAFSFYAPNIPIQDQWGTPFIVDTGTGADTTYPNYFATANPAIVAGNQDSTIAATGRDNASGNINYNAQNPETAYFVINSLSDFDWDLVMTNGSWICCPRGVTVSGS